LVDPDVELGHVPVQGFEASELEAQEEPVILVHTTLERQLQVFDSPAKTSLRELRHVLRLGQAAQECAQHEHPRYAEDIADDAGELDVRGLEKAHGVSRSRTAGHYLAIARETIREREGVPGGRADELMEAVDGLRAAVDILGPPTFGMLRLLAHWATQGGSVKVNEDELLAELRTVGADEWEQAIAEAERDLQETPGATDQKEKR
jgi:hypothetical protein